MKFIKKKYNYSEQLPENLLLLLTHQRAGSTWFFDMCRSLPFCDVHPSYMIFSRLGLSGRRYPRDLSLKIDDYKEGQIIETLPNQWERIRIFKTPFVDVNLPVFFVEKVHPHFATPSWSHFKKQLSLLSKEKNLKIVLQIRSPEETILSFLKYQVRNPKWYFWIKTNKVIDFFSKEYSRLMEVYQEFDTKVVYYKSLKNDITSSLLDIISYCSSKKLDLNYWENIIEEIETSTKREGRPDLTSQFFEAPKSSCNFTIPETIRVLMPGIETIFKRFDQTGH